MCFEKDRTSILPKNQTFIMGRVDKNKGRYTHSFEYGPKVFQINGRVGCKLSKRDIWIMLLPPAGLS